MDILARHEYGMPAQYGVIPSVRDDDVCTFDCFLGVAAPPDGFVASELDDAVPHWFGTLISRVWRRSDAHFVTKAGIGDEHVVENIGRVAHIGNGEGA